MSSIIDISNNLTQELSNYKFLFLNYGTNSWNKGKNNYDASKLNITNYLQQANTMLDTLNNEIGSTQTQLVDERDILSDKKGYYNNLNNKLNSADTLKYDFNALYSEQSLRNSEMFLGLVFLGLVVFGISRQ
jgi:hypothetical protein